MCQRIERINISLNQCRNNITKEGGVDCQTNPPTEFRSNHLCSELCHKAIKELREPKEIGVQNIALTYVKCLQANAIMNPTQTHNSSLASFKTSHTWKLGRVVPLLKRGKTEDRSNSFRPMAHIAQLIESPLLPFADSESPLTDRQHDHRRADRYPLTAIAS